MFRFADRHRSLLPCLTHHDILRLIGPFTRRGRRIDLHASDRQARRLAFESIRHANVEGASGGTETLALDNRYAGHFRLTRTVRLDDGRKATVDAEGGDVDALLAAVSAVPVASHFATHEGFAMTRSYRIEPSDSPAARLSGATIRFARWEAAVTVPPMEGVAARVTLRARDTAAALPEDLLAVLGWDWSLVERDRHGWEGRIRLHGKGSDRDHDATAKVDLLAAHLSRTLAEPPRRFHERLAARRWAVTLRQSLPLLALVMLLVDAALAPIFRATHASPLILFALAIPPTLLVTFLVRSEAPRMGWPSPPRPPLAASW